MKLAELNVGYAAHPLDDPRMADFMNNLDRINALAERSPRLCLAAAIRQRQRNRHRGAGRRDDDLQHVHLG